MPDVFNSVLARNGHASDRRRHGNPSVPVIDTHTIGHERPNDAPCLTAMSFALSHEDHIVLALET